MSVKTILITEPQNSVLRKLAMQFLRKPDVRAVCFDDAQSGGEELLLQMISAQDGGPWFRNCEESPIDEIWHTANTAGSWRNARKETTAYSSLAGPEKLRLSIICLLFVCREKSHYRLCWAAVTTSRSIA